MDASPNLIIGNNEYALGTLDAFTEFHIARRIAPAMQALGVSILELIELGKDLQNDVAMMAVSAPVLQVIAKMPNEDVDFVLKACLRIVSRRPAGMEAKFAPIMSGASMQFSDIRMPEMIQLTLYVLKEKMGGFFGPLLAGQQLGKAS